MPSSIQPLPAPPRDSRKTRVHSGPVLLGLVALCLGGCIAIQRRALYHPTHRTSSGELTPWFSGTAAIGCSREVDDPGAVWLLLHGNAGQAADRAYALPRFSPRDSVYILEYPGYGPRPGRPSPGTINAAAREAYGILRRAFPGKPVGVVGESLGTGPACLLTREPLPPDKLVLVNPYESIAEVAEEHAALLPSRLVFASTWDNRKALAGYRGAVAIFSAEHDTLIPVRHGRTLADLLPQAQFTVIPGGHNDWPRQSALKIRFP
ncbi:MAG TPA: hypothetical protein VEB66_11710 [Opitutaceae bacterium]|nr:hypothetical protein [Opitutaceae bacterium]